LLTRRIFAESAHFADLSNFSLIQQFLLSHHQVFVRTNQILMTQHISLNQLIFAETANFCLLSYLLLSFAGPNANPNPNPNVVVA